MGNKQITLRKHFYFYFACCITAFLFFQGCGSIVREYQYLTQQSICYNLLNDAKNLVFMGEYEAALKKDEEILKLFPRIKDQVFFHMGLIHIDLNNPNRNLNKALICFGRLVEEHPESSLSNQALIKMKLIEKDMDKSETIRCKNRQIENQNKQIKDLTGSMEFLKKKSRFKREKMGDKIEDLQQTMKEMKEIDKDIEEQKENLKAEKQKIMKAPKAKNSDSDIVK